jgi:hypothetical protein
MQIVELLSLAFIEQLRATGGSMSFRKLGVWSKVKVIFFAGL